MTKYEELKQLRKEVQKLGMKYDILINAEPCKDNTINLEMRYSAFLYEIDQEIRKVVKGKRNEISN